MTVALPEFVHPEKEVRSVSLDPCIVEQIKALWAAGFSTLGCCCGHGKEGPEVIIEENYTDTEIARMAQVLKKADTRRWKILQWRLMEARSSEGLPACLRRARTIVLDRVSDMAAILAFISITIGLMIAVAGRLLQWYVPGPLPRLISMVGEAGLAIAFMLSMVQCLSLRDLLARSGLRYGIGGRRE